jgi:hypothetical protein
MYSAIVVHRTSYGINTKAAKFAGYRIGAGAVAATNAGIRNDVGE